MDVDVRVCPVGVPGRCLANWALLYCRKRLRQVAGQDQEAEYNLESLGECLGAFEIQVSM